MSLSRRTLATAIAAATAGAPRPTLAQDLPVVVGTWGGDYGDILAASVDRPLAVPAGLAVAQDIAPAPTRKTKLLAERTSRRGTMDLAGLSDVDMYELAQQNLFDPVPQGVLKRLPMVIPGLRRPYSVPHIYSARVILYNPSKVATPPRSYADLWRPEWQGRVGLSDLLYAQYVETAAIVGGGGSSNFEPAWDRLRAWRAMGTRVYPSNEALAAALKSEEVWATVMWLARGFMWQEAGLPLAHVVPEEGATSITYEFAVPRNARNKENAWRYIDLALEPSAQAGFARRMGYVPTVTDAPLPPELAARISLTAAQQARLRTPDYGYQARISARLRDFWDREFKA